MKIEIRGENTSVDLSCKKTFFCGFYPVPASIEPLENVIVKKGETITLSCKVSGKPPPSISWTHVSTVLKHYNETWVISDIDVSDLGEYRCDASNIYGYDTESMTILYEGKCM